MLSIQFLTLFFWTEISPGLIGNKPSKCKNHKLLKLAFYIMVPLAEVYGNRKLKGAI